MSIVFYSYYLLLLLSIPLVRVFYSVHKMMENSTEGDFVNEVEDLNSKTAKKVVVSLDHIDWKEAEIDLKWAVLLKLASGKSVHKDAIEETFGRVWRLNEWDTLLITFINQEDQERVLEGGPWTFEGTAILLQSGSLE